MTAPDRIWASSITENYGEWQIVTDGLPRPTEYIRADLYAALEAQLAALEAQLAALSPEEAQQEIPSGYGEYTPITVKSSTASFTRPAEQAVTKAMVEAAQRIRDVAMQQTVIARLPECGEFGAIAQDADWLVDALKAAMEAKG